MDIVKNDIIKSLKDDTLIDLPFKNYHSFSPLYQKL